MIKPVAKSIALYLLCNTPLAFANIVIDFDEGAPKDRFTMTNTGTCSFKQLSVGINLSKSRGQLIFDTTGTGAGVEVFQPFEVTTGKVELSVDVKDGDSQLALNVSQLSPSESVSFTIDVDDTLTNSQLGNIQVTGSEIAGGVVTIRSPSITPVKGVFSQDNKAVVNVGC